MNYNELPDALWERLAPLFDVRETEVPRLRQLATFDAKQPAMWFSADSQRKREAADDRVREAVDRWARSAYEALEGLRR
ncbi:hypothetical protein D9M68_980160 [compost metagenome]